MAKDDQMPNIRYDWIPVGEAQGVPFNLLEYGSSKPSRLTKKAAIYRWGFFNKDAPDPYMAYVGEAKDLAHRIRGYTGPNLREGTCLKIKREIEKAIQSKHTVKLEILKIIEPVRLNRVVICNENLADAFLRKMLENFILADFDVVNCKLLNVDLNIFDARRRRAAKNNPYADILREQGLDVDTVR